VDTKASVHVGDYSRGGKSRGAAAIKALDHDMFAKEKLVPGGVLEPVAGKSFLFFGVSNKTSDFVADGIDLWWQERKGALPRATPSALFNSALVGHYHSTKRGNFVISKSLSLFLHGLSSR
jgi:hypothetical protein